MVSRALLAAGVPAEKLAVVEIVPEMAGHLREVLPGVNVICGDAFELARDLPERLHGKVGTAICGIPLVLLPLDRQRRFVAAVEAVAPGKGFLLYTYCVTSPLPYGKLGPARQARGLDAAQHPAGQCLAVSASAVMPACASPKHWSQRAIRRWPVPDLCSTGAKPG